MNEGRLIVGCIGRLYGCCRCCCLCCLCCRCSGVGRFLSVDGDGVLVSTVIGDKSLLFYFII